MYNQYIIIIKGELVMKIKNRNWLLTLILSAAMIFIMLPAVVFAEGTSTESRAWFNEQNGPITIDLRVGESAQIFTDLQGDIIYEAGNTRITVDSSGKVTGKSIGVSYVNVRNDDYALSLVVNVVHVHLISFYPEKGSSFDTAAVETAFKSKLRYKLANIYVSKADDHFDITLHANDTAGIQGYEITGNNGALKRLYKGVKPARGRLYGFAYKPMTEYDDLTLIRKEMNSSDLLPDDKNLKIHTLIEMPIEKVELTIRKPVAGTKITFDENNPTDVSIMPKVTVPESAHYLASSNTPGMPVYAYWFDENADINDNEVMPFSGTFESGKKYLAVVALTCKPGYYFSDKLTEESSILVNGSPANAFYLDQDTEEIYHGFLGVMAKIPAAASGSSGTGGNGSSGTESAYDLKKDVKGKPISAVEKALLSRRSDDDLKGSDFIALRAHTGKVKKTSQVIKWNKVKGASKYYVYASKCGKNNKVKKIKVTKKTSFTHKKLKSGKYYKYLIIAVNAKGKVITSSKMIHSATKGGKLTNVKSVRTAAKKNKVKIKKGKKFKLKAKEVKASKKLELRVHRKIEYASANPKVASVSSKGVIKGRKKGTAYVYAYAQNGVFAKIKVTVK